MNHPITDPVAEKRFQDATLDSSVRRGSVFAVNGNDGSLGSQFFVCLSDKHQEALRSVQYTQIGAVIDGFAAIEAVETSPELNEKSHKNGKVRGKWKTEAWIESVEVTYNPYASEE